MEKAIIIGAGPAGLTAAYELLAKTEIVPIILEKSGDIGGISKTVVHNGNRIDIGGHRFFSKSEFIMKWWQKILPLEGAVSGEIIKRNIFYQNKSTTVELHPAGPNPNIENKVMLIRNRLSRIFFLKKFFDYPITLNRKTISNLGFIRIIRIGWSYTWIQIIPLKKTVNLEEFFINRFGKELYHTFFKDYTEKVWGVPCKDIDAEWGAQRIKKLNVKRALLHAMKAAIKKDNSIEQKNTDTSLIEQFMYPKLGPGQMWETVAAIVQERGGIIIMNSEVVGMNINSDSVTALSYFDKSTKKEEVISGNYFFSTMPVKHLIRSIEGLQVPENVSYVSEGLQYRDFITVGILVNEMKIKNKSKDGTSGKMIPDNWVYIQEKEVKLGRLQIFNNWSPAMVQDNEKVWMGLEYFCNEGDELWEMKDDDFISFAIKELTTIGIIEEDQVVDSTIIRVPKTYPAYFGTYSRFQEIRNFTDNIQNLFLVGRNGMHKYNNQDHSMLTSIVAVENIINGRANKDNIWDINTEMEYHEQK